MKNRPLLTLSGILLSPICLAESYLNVGYSSTKLKFATSLPSDATVLDEDGNAAYFDFGYLFTENLAAEIGYRSAKSTESYTYTGDTLAGSSEASVIKLGVKAFTSRDESWYAFGSLGVAMVDLETTVTANEDNVDPNLTVGQKLKDDSTNAYYGVGVGYKFNDAIRAEVAYANYGKAGDAVDANQPGEQKLSELTLGVSYAF